MAFWPRGRKRNRCESAVRKLFKADDEDSELMVCQVKVDDNPDSPSASSAGRVCGQKIRISQEGSKNLGNSNTLPYLPVLTVHVLILLWFALCRPVLLN